MNTRQKSITHPSNFKLKLIEIADMVPECRPQFGGWESYTINDLLGQIRINTETMRNKLMRSSNK